MSNQKILAIYRNHIDEDELISIFDDGRVGFWDKSNLNMAINSPIEKIIDRIYQISEDCAPNLLGYAVEEHHAIHTKNILYKMQKLWPEEKTSQNINLCSCSIQQIMINGCVCGGK